MAGDEGFEPPIPGPEPGALPLGESPLIRFTGVYCTLFSNQSQGTKRSILNKVHYYDIIIRYMPRECLGTEEYGWEACRAGEQRRVTLNGLLRCDGCDTIMQSRASEDQLTGLPNRYVLEDTFTKLRDRANLLGGIAIDLTSFKRVNDVQGHGAGDKMLKIAAASVRKGDEFGARHGGDEFFVLAARKRADQELIDTSLVDEDRLRSVSDRIAGIFLRNTVVQRYNKSVAEDQQLRMRIGCSVYEQGWTLEQLMSQADSKGEVVEPKNFYERSRDIIRKNLSL